MDTISLIANSGIQFQTMDLVIDPNADVAEGLRFYEWSDGKETKLEYAHYLPALGVWVSWRSLKEECFLDIDGNVIPVMPADLDHLKVLTQGVDCFGINDIEGTISGIKADCPLDLLENKWLPLPYFELNQAGQSEFGPSNWCRLKLVLQKREGAVRYYKAILAFDTKVAYDQADDERPVFWGNDTNKQYALCNNRERLIDFFSKTYACKWVDEFVAGLIYGENYREILDNLSFPRYKYVAYYIYFLYYLQHLHLFPAVRIYRDQGVGHKNVDMVIDIGNSRTCALLFESTGGEERPFTKVKPLEIVDISEPWKIYDHPFDMRLAFHKPDFGEMGPWESMQFKLPSIVRIGEEATRLIYHTKNSGLLSSDERTYYSSPKRYLWDTDEFKGQWEFIQLEGDESEQNKQIWLEGISEQFNTDGSLNTSGDGFGSLNCYSRRSLMTFVFLEIFTHAYRQINSANFRIFNGDLIKPRKLNRIVITTPTTMSMEEQISLRRCAEEAGIALSRFLSGTYRKPYDSGTDIFKLEVIPSVKELSFKQEDICYRKEWGYDEATCNQLVFLYAEIAERYKGKCESYFEMYGKHRTDLGGYDKKSLTIGSIDIGGGTTDLMICAYQYVEAGKALLTPVPLYWESFYYAGDDLLKELIRQIIIESPLNDESERGCRGVIYHYLQEAGVADVEGLINTFFGRDTAQMSFEACRMRNDFNVQVSVPIAMKYLELTQRKSEDCVLTFRDFFVKNTPAPALLDYFASHFGVRFEEIKWKFSSAKVNEIVVRVFEPLLRKLSSLLYAYGCDFVLLSGRPTSLSQVEELFLKLYPVSPNRMITLNDYRVGQWYPGTDGSGYFSDQKSIVAVGAMIGCLATRGALSTFELDMSQMIRKLLPTSDYMGLYDAVSRNVNMIFISPEINKNTLEIAGLPVYIGCRQLDTDAYPARVLYCLDFDDKAISRFLKKPQSDLSERSENLMKEVEQYKLKIRQNMPLRVKIIREYRVDKELIKIEMIQDRNREEVSSEFFRLGIQTIGESGMSWLDSGEFILSIRRR